jgi:hypothetical protein
MGFFVVLFVLLSQWGCFLMKFDRNETFSDFEVCKGIK